MALDVAVGSFNITTGAAGGTVTITPGFETKALILWWNGRTEAVDTIGGATIQRGFGFATNTGYFSACTTRDEDGVGTTITNSFFDAVSCIMEVDAAGAKVGYADVQSVNSTQVVFEIMDDFVTNLRVCYLALGGSDITGAEIGYAAPSGTGNLIVPTTKEGKVVFFASSTYGDHSASCFGVATDSANEYVWAAKAGDASTSGLTAAYCRKGECLTSLDIGTNVAMDRVEFVSFNTTPSFTLNYLECQYFAGFLWFQLSGNFQVGLGDLVTLATTGTVTETGVAFEPKALLMLSANRAESASDVSTSHDELSIGAATSSSNRLCMQSSSLNGATDSRTATAVEYDHIYNNVATATDLIEGKADFTGFTKDGFTLNMSDADPVASFCWYVAFASAPQPKPITAMYRQSTRRATVR